MLPAVITVRPEAPADGDALRQVNTAAFGRPEEARLVDALRERARLYLGLVAIVDGAIAGHIAFTHATLHGDAADWDIAALGPMAVRPALQRSGIGSALVREGLEACRRLGHDLVVVVGHPGFYPRFGFVPARPRGITCEFAVPDDVFMVAELTPGARRGRRGVVRYAPEFTR
jgi:putative acetyltransferase